MKVNTYLTDGFETVEALAVIDILRRAGITVDVVSVTGDLNVTSAQNVIVVADRLLNDESEEADVLFLPGGMPGTNTLKAHEGLKNAICKANKQGRRIAAICAAPSILGEMGLLKGRTATCYPGFEDKLEGVSYTRQGVVTDGNITTARGLGYALDLGIELIRLLMGPQHAQMVKDSIQYDQV